VKLHLISPCVDNYNDDYDDDNNNNNSNNNNNNNKDNNKLAIFDFVTAVLLRNQVFSGVTLSLWMRILPACFDPRRWTTVLRNVASLSPSSTVSYPEIPESSIQHLK
jgi:hypothetical protein